MLHYRIYTTNAEGHILGPAEVIECSGDQEAIEKATCVANGKAVELWEGSRLIVMFPGDA